jgi:acyl carrier protein
MNTEEIRRKILEFLGTVAPETDSAQLNSKENIREAMGIDSFDFLNFVVMIDECFGIQTPEEDYGKLNSMEDIIAYIQRRVVR